MWFKDKELRKEIEKLRIQMTILQMDWLVAKNREQKLASLLGYEWKEKEEGWVKKEEHPKEAWKREAQEIVDLTMKCADEDFTEKDMENIKKFLKKPSSKKPKPKK